MFRAYSAALAAAIGLLAGCTPSAPVPPPADVVLAISVYMARSYNAEVMLYREAPNVAPDTYWVYSDGYLAGLDVSRWNVPALTKWTVLVERAIVAEEVFAYTHRYIDLGNGVRSEAHDPGAPRLADWQEYADRLLLAAINARNAGDKARERELVTLAKRMWNGKGLTDKVHQSHGYYETYKTALYYYVTGEPAAHRVLLSLQERGRNSNRYGGVYTEYGEDGKPLPHTDVNVETTSVALRALLRR